jgi:hypothetical protein
MRPKFNRLSGRQTRLAVSGVRDRPDPESPLATVSVPALAYLEGELMDAKVSFLQRARSTRAAPPSKPASRPPATKAAQGPQFVMTSREQARRLMQVSNATRPVFERLQFLAPYGKAQGKAFELPDATTFGFSRDQRSRALTELKKCGLISVKDRPGQSPLITMLWEYKK